MMASTSSSSLTTPLDPEIWIERFFFSIVIIVIDIHDCGLLQQPPDHIQQPGCMTAS